MLTYASKYALLFYLLNLTIKNIYRILKKERLSLFLGFLFYFISNLHKNFTHAVKTAALTETAFVTHFARFD